MLKQKEKLLIETNNLTEEKRRRRRKEKPIDDIQTNPNGRQFVIRSIEKYTIQFRCSFGNEKLKLLHNSLCFHCSFHSQFNENDAQNYVNTHF